MFVKHWPPALSRWNTHLGGERLTWNSISSKGQWSFKTTFMYPLLERPRPWNTIFPGGLPGSGYMEVALKHLFPLLLIYALMNVCLFMYTASVMFDYYCRDSEPSYIGGIAFQSTPPLEGAGSFNEPEGDFPQNTEHPFIAWFELLVSQTRSLASIMLDFHVWRSPTVANELVKFSFTRPFRRSHNLSQPYSY